MNRFKKAGAVGAAVAITAALALTSAPAQAAGEFGSVKIINPSGGTSDSDGIRILIAGGQMQVYSKDVQQLYKGLSTEGLPTADADTHCELYNYFSMYLGAGANSKVVGCPNFDLDPENSVGLVEWATGSITSNLTAGDKDGTVTLTLVSGEVAIGKTITLQVLYTYVYPNRYVDIETSWTIPTGIPGFTGAKTYFNADAILAGSDRGNQIEGNLADGSAIMGVISRDGLSIEAFNQLPGQSMTSWAGFYQCAWRPGKASDPGCPSAQAGWVVNGGDAPGTISTGTDVDNGWGVQSPAVTVAGTSVSSWRTYFVSCLDSDTSASQCVDRAAPVAEPTLPDTGLDSGALTGLIGGGAALLAIGIAIVVIRRRSTV